MASETIDRGLSVAWYDLPEDGRQRYLDWLHERYVPKLLKSPGVLWAAHYATEESIGPLPTLRHTTDAAVAAGHRYIFMLGARDAHAFSVLTPFNRRGKIDSADQAMLDMRIGERLGIFTEEARVEGPHAHEREGRYTPAPCIQLGSFNSGHWTEEDELLAWYADFRLPSMSDMPASIGMRKYASVSGWAKHAVMYEFTSLEGRAKHFRAHEHKNPRQSEWTKQVIARLVHAPGSPNVAQRIFPPTRQGA